MGVRLIGSYTPPYSEHILTELARPKRVVKYKRGYDMWTYIAGEKRLPGAL